MALEEDFRSLITANAPLMALVRVVAWNERPQGSQLPAITLNLISQPHRYTYSGADTLIQSRVQADIWALSTKAVIDIDRLLVPVVDGFRGTIGNTEFSVIFIESRFDGTEDPATGSAPIHRISRDLMVNHKEA